ncbi:MAG: sigma-70 family RNA polymerase sigma factor [Clostridia bacterium]
MEKSLTKQDVLVEQNLKLVHWVCHRYFSKAPIEYEDAVQNGMVGLINAARGYDETKGFAFSTLAVLCIRRAIMGEISKDRNPRGCVSLNAPLVSGEEFTLEDLIPDNTDVEKDAEGSWLLLRILDHCSNQQKQIIEMRIAGLSFAEIGEITRVTKSVIVAFIERLHTVLQKEGVIGYGKQFKRLEQSFIRNVGSVRKIRSVRRGITSGAGSRTRYNKRCGADCEQCKFSSKSSDRKK